VYDIATMEQLLAKSVMQPRFSTFLFGLFALLALALAAIGLYGVMSYVVAQRAHEIGVRMALGAQRRDVLGLIVRQGLTLTMIGSAVGLAAALAVTRLLASMLYGVSATDAPTFIGVSLFLIAVALLASYMPARRATKVDPLTALRHE
jgi:putative ABC transport system permease protein